MKNRKQLILVICALCFAIGCKNPNSENQNTIKNDMVANSNKHKEGYVLDFEDDFSSSELDDSKWFPYYLPHWSSKKEAAAKYDIREGNLVLKITEEQRPFNPKLDPGVKCSNVQTGIFSGKVGEKIGQHGHRGNYIINEEQINQRLYTPHYGYFEIRAKAHISSSNMVAFWMIGYEDKPEYSGEICVMEIFGRQIDGIV